MCTDQSKPNYSVVTCFIESNGKVLVLKRNRRDIQFGLWGIPGGKLDGAESPEQGLVREIKEELSISVDPSQLELLDSTAMKNECDGHYLLYLYYLKLDHEPVIQINPSEHSEYQWTTIECFKDYPLLFCQGAAFDLVKDILVSKKMKTKEVAYVLSQ